MLIAAILAAAASVPEQRVRVRAYGCHFATTKSVKVFAQNRSLFGPDGDAMIVPAHQGPAGRIEFVFALPPGPYYISYRTDDNRCSSGGEGLTILPGHARDISVSMRPGSWMRDWHARRFFSGALPPHMGLAVSVVVSKSPTCPIDKDVVNAPEREYPAIIDGDAYYVGYVSGSHAFLRLRSAGFDILYISLPDAPSPNDQYVVRNITDDDVQRLLTPASPNRPTCIMKPSGSSGTFDVGDRD